MREKVWLEISLSQEEDDRVGLGPGTEQVVEGNDPQLAVYPDPPLSCHPPIGSDQNFPASIPQHFSNLVILHLPAHEDGRVFRNVGIQNSDAEELPRRKHTTSILTQWVNLLASYFVFIFS